MKNNEFYNSCSDNELFGYWKKMTKELLLRIVQKFGV